MTQEETQKYMLIGLATDHGIDDKMHHYHAELQILHAAAKEKGEKDEAAFGLALGIFSLELR